MSTEASARARVAERRADALGVEVHALRALATRCGRNRSGDGLSDVSDDAEKSHPMRAWLDDPGAGFSAQVARAAVDAASVASEERVRSAVLAARAAAREADGFKIETELLRSLVDDGFLPGGSSGKSGWGAAEARAGRRLRRRRRGRAPRRPRTRQAAKEAAAADGRKARGVRGGEARGGGPRGRVRDRARGAQGGGTRARGRLLDGRARGVFVFFVFFFLDKRGFNVGCSDGPPFVVAHPDPNARLKIVGAAKLVAAARVASERVEQAAEALRDAEARPEARRIEVETLEFLLGGNGTAGGALERARGYVVGAPKAAEAARDAAHALTHKRLRAESQGGRRPERRCTAPAGVPAAVGGRAEANARRSLGGPFGAGSRPTPASRDGEVATLVEEVARLERSSRRGRRRRPGCTRVRSIAAAAAPTRRPTRPPRARRRRRRAALRRGRRARRAGSPPFSPSPGEPADLAFLARAAITAMSRRMASAAGPACAAA